MYKKALVLTDNIVQYERFRNLVQAPAYSSVQFTFRHSPSSTEFLTHPDFTGADHSLNVKNSVDALIADFDIIFSIHCKQIFPAALVQRVKCINVHPGYNPINRGWYPQVFAIIHKRMIGAIIHEIDEYLDNGPIIDRVALDHHVWETSKDIYDRILMAEMALLEKNLPDIIAGNYTTFLPEGEGHLYLKKDFRNLCQLNLEEVATMGSFVDTLRALTHGRYKNAYFTDSKTGKKVFVSINLEVEQA